MNAVERIESLALRHLTHPITDECDLLEEARSAGLNDRELGPFMRRARGYHNPMTRMLIAEAERVIVAAETLVELLYAQEG